MDEKTLLEAIRAIVKDEIQSEVKPISDDLSSLKKDMAKHNHYVEPLLKAVKDGIDGVTEHNQRVERLEDRIEGHSHRIWALEQKAI